jgi:hypothetical protein
MRCGSLHLAVCYAGGEGDLTCRRRLVWLTVWFVMTGRYKVLQHACLVYVPSRLAASPSTSLAPVLVLMHT